MGAHFPAVELNDAIWFSTLFSMSGFLWHSCKWASRFSRFLQYTSGLEVLACSLDTDPVPFLEPLSKVTATFRRKMQILFGCILTDRYVTRAVLCPGPKAVWWIPSKMCKFPSWDPLDSQMIFFRFWSFCVFIIYLIQILPAWLLALTLYMCISIHFNFWCVYSLDQYLFWLHSSLF